MDRWLNFVLNMIQNSPTISHWCPHLRDCAPWVQQRPWWTLTNTSAKLHRMTLSPVTFARHYNRMTPHSMCCCKNFHSQQHKKPHFGLDFILSIWPRSRAQDGLLFWNTIYFQNRRFGTLCRKNLKTYDVSFKQFILTFEFFFCFSIRCYHLHKKLFN